MANPQAQLAQPTAMSFDMRPKAVRKWIEELPLANIGEATRQVFHTLREVNSLDVPAKQRFNLLDELEEPLSIILPALHKHFAYQPYPMPLKARRVAQLSIDLQKQLVTAYRLVIESKPGSWLQQKSHEHMQLMAMHHLLELFDGLLCTYRMASIAYPRGLWRNIYRLYLSAWRIKRHEFEFPARKGSELEQSSIDYLFRRIVLLALVSPQKVGRYQMQEVAGSIPVWAPLLEFVESAEPMGDPVARNVPYVVALESDRPPGMVSLLCGREECGPSFLLDPKRIDRRLVELLKDEQAERFTLRHKGENYVVSRRSARSLLVNWCRPPQRQDERRQVKGRFEAVIGLRAVHYHLTDGRHAAHGIEVSEEISLEDVAVAAPVVSGKAGEFVGDRDPDEDVWQMTFASPLQAKKSWTENADVDRAYRTAAAEVLDASRNGYRLRLRADAVHRVTVGDLIGLRSAPDKPWAAGSVRWLTEQDQHHVQVGVQLLCTQCDAATVLARKEAAGKGEEVAIDSLVGRARDGRSVLLVPSLHSLEHGELALRHAGKTVAVHRTQALVESPMFEATYFDTAALDEPAQKKPAAKARTLPEAVDGIDFNEDDYASLWSDL